jgi:hypothetical protein
MVSKGVVGVSPLHKSSLEQDKRAKNINDKPSQRFMDLCFNGN